MKLKNLYLFFIIILSFYTKAQSNEINKPVLANSESLVNDSSKSKGQDNLPKLSVQDSKSDSNKAENMNQQPNLKVSEALNVKEIKAVINPKK